MQKVIYSRQIQEYADYIDQAVIDYIGDGQVESYESFNSFVLIAFDRFDPRNIEDDPSQILIYLDDDDLFLICENEEAFHDASSWFAEAKTNEYALYLFFRNLLRGSSKLLEELENRVSDLDDSVSEGIREGQKEQLADLRYEVLRLKKYYGHLEFLFEEICDNDNGLISGDCLRYFEILHNRSLSFVAYTQNLKDYVTQVRESYQAQIGIEQNDLMKIFTLVTSIFMPLSLIAGWYGMNVRMPEVTWRFGYLFVVILCILVSVVWFVLFKRKKWL